MPGFWCGSVPAFLSVKDNLQQRGQELERSVVNCVNTAKEVRKLQQLTVAKIKELKETSKKLSMDCNQEEVYLHVLQEKVAVNSEEVCHLKSRVLELKKEIALAIDGQHHLHVTKSEAETDKEKSQKELMKRHEAFLKAIAYYKKKLHIRLRFEENGLILVHFLNISTPECEMCSVKLSHTDNKWSLLAMDPVLPCENVLANKLESTQDIQGFISHVRKLFMQLSANKKQHATVKVSKKS